MKELLIFSPILMYFVNRMRGMRTEEFIPEEWGIHKLLPNGGPFAGLAVGALFALSFQNFMLGLFIAIAYIAGESLGWMKWIRPIRLWGRGLQSSYNSLHAKDLRGREIHWLSNKIFKETEKYTQYCVLSLMIRSAIWFVPIYAVLISYQLVSISTATVSTVFLAIAFPLVHWHIMVQKDRLYVEAEKWFGVMYGLAFAAIYLFLPS